MPIILACDLRGKGRGGPGFTIVEVLVATAIIGIVFSTVISAYTMSNDRTEWNSYSLAAQSIAQQGVEQLRAAKWDPQAFPVVDEMGATNFTQVEVLDVTPGGVAIYATNYVSISTISISPQLRQLRADCVWRLGSRRSNAGPFTNSAITLRAPDQ
jgi:prepilin-type N-terminal cleavage/methylation domain-containing protein